MVDGIAAVWVPVTDMERAVAFYRDTLGLDVTETDPSWSEADANGLKIGLNAREKAEQGAGGGAVLTFQPESSIDEEVQRLTQAGVEFTGGISDHEWGRIAPFKDSEGNDLQLYTAPRS
jgi:predicted enzyme related to lactoylglutathione lyase